MEMGEGAKSSNDVGALHVVSAKEYVAGTRSAITLEYKVGEAGISIGGHLWIIFDIRQGGDRPQVSDPKASGYVTCQTSGGASLDVRIQSGRYLEFLPDMPEIVNCIEIEVRDCPLVRGDRIIITLGKQGEGGKGFLIPTNSIDQFKFVDFADTTGQYLVRTEASFWPPERVKAYEGTSLPNYRRIAPIEGVAAPKLRRSQASIRVICENPLGLDVVAPSQVAVNEPLILKLKAVDRYLNVAEEYSGRVQLQTPLGGASKPIHFSPKDKGVRVYRSSISFTKPGVYYVMAKDPLRGFSARSNPIECLESQGKYRIFWGELHGMLFNQRPLSYYFRYGRDVAFLDFCAGQQFSYTCAVRGFWDRFRKIVRRFNKPGEFVSFLSYECGPPDAALSHKNVYFLNDDEPLLFSEFRLAVESPAFQQKLDPAVVRCKSLKELYDRLRSRKAMAIAHHTTQYENCHDPQIERLVQVCSKYGISEYLGCPRYDRGNRPIQEALALGYKLGIVGGSDTHDSRPANQAPEPGVPHPAGLTAVYAKALTREALWEALWNRRVYATSGPRIIMKFEMDGHIMGSQYSSDRKPVVYAHVCGTEKIMRIALIRNNDVIFVHQGSSEIEGFKFEDHNPPAGESFYYLRVTQADGNMAWSSPIWHNLK